MQKDTGEARKCSIICAMMGMVVFVSIFGIAILDFTYINWLLPIGISHPDLSQHYLGWVAYRDSAYHFPIGLVEGVNYPHLISVIYMDALPLFSFVFKLLSPLLPENFQFFGLFAILCYALQGYFSGLLLYRFTRSKYYTIIASLFFTTSNIMLFRMFWHTGLAAHWIILASFCVWAYDDVIQSRRKKIGIWCVLTIIALLTEVYLVPMVWGILVCYLIQKFLLRKKIWYAVEFIFFAGISFLLTGWLFGLFYGGVSAQGDGLGAYSFNLNSFINTISNEYHLFLKPLKLSDEHQFEGCAYLGLGILLLCACNIVCIFACKKWDKIRLYFKKYIWTKNTLLPFGVLIVGFVCFAASPVVSFGAKSFTIPIGKIGTQIWSIFRSSGRMIWPVWYLIVISVVICWYYLMRKEKGVLYTALFLLLVIQIADFMPLIKSKAEITQPDLEYKGEIMKSGAWDEIAEKYEHIVFYPKADEYMYWSYVPVVFQTYAQRYGLTMNTTYFSRDIGEQTDKEVYRMFEEAQKSGEWDADTFYICGDELPEYDTGLYPYWIEGIMVYLPEPLTGNYDQCYYIENVAESIQMKQK